MAGPDSTERSSAKRGPRCVRPEALRPQLRVLDGWSSSASALFDWIRGRVPPELLREIAEGDYGCKADEHFAALREVCGSGLVPSSPTWVPFEVARLYRWRDAGAVDHIGRALSCLLLLLVPDSEPTEPVMTTGPVLAESCLALGSEATRLGEQYFAWAAETEELPSAQEHDEYGFARADQPTALLLLFLLRAATDPGDVRLDSLSRELAENGSFELWRVGFEMANSTSARLWSRLVPRVLEPLLSAHPPVARVLGGLQMDRPIGSARTR